MRYRMTTSPSNAVTARVVLLAGLLLAVLLLPSPLRHSAYAQEMIEYPENSEVPVAAYVAVDPDDGDEISWTLSGDDAGDFTIENGVLEFMSPPNFENPTSSTTSGTTEAQNTYTVTVEASDGVKDAAGTETDTTEVTVKVTNEDEDGVVTLSAVQPREATQLTATHTDPDGVRGSVEWQWYRSSSVNGPWTEIEFEEETPPSATYTPTPDDVGKYLRATASYSDGHTTGDDADKTAHGVSDHAVLADTSNKPPEFPDQDPETDAVEKDQTREVAENTAAGQPVGDPVAATDANGDTLTYTLGGSDADDFTIDRMSGQIKVGAGTTLDYDQGLKTYTVTVTATDPTDESDTITVTITVTDVDEAPELAEPTVSEGHTAKDHEENTPITTPVSTYSATDQEDNNSELMWLLSGADAGRFAISDTTAAEVDLTFQAVPDFEAPTDSGRNNAYNVTVVVTDSGGNTDSRDVTVTVTNLDEPGTVTLSALQPEVEARLEAELEDPDGRVSSLTWKWDRSLNRSSGWVDITNATSPTYMPAEGDENHYLRATASYKDGEGDTIKSANDVSDNAVQAKDDNNVAPMFPDQDSDTDGIQNTRTTRSVDENTVADQVVGAAVTATDSGGGLTYSLGGRDAGSFKIDRDDGEIRVGDETNLDFEAKSSYTVTVTATDPSLASKTITVTVMVTDVDEDPTATEGETAIDYPEKGTRAVDTYAATDPEDDSARPRKPLTWSLSGNDDDKFTISARGVLTFNDSPDYEAAADADRNNEYDVTVTATDSGDNTATWGVTVTVTNVEEDGVVKLSTLQPREGIQLTATLTDPDGASGSTPPITSTAITSATWQWARSTNRRSWTDIEEDAPSATYKPTPDDVGSYLRATASYNDGHSDGDGADKTANEVSDHAVLADTSNKPPVFPDQDPDMDGDQSDQASREIAENSAPGTPVGNPVAATDPNSDTLTYTLGSAASFTIDRGTGQIRVGAGTVLDYEVPPTYVGIVTATDPVGEEDTITVIITVTDVDEKPTVPDGDTAIDYREDRTDAVGTYTATDPERDTIEWTLSGYDADDFTIDGGVLTFEASPDYEKPTDTGRNNVYNVTVEASDSEGNTASRDVTVTVTNVEEPGTVTLSTVRPEVGTGLTAMLTDPDGEISSLTWKWASANTPSGSYTPIPGATSATYKPSSDYASDYLRATASYNDGEGEDRTAFKTSELAVQPKNINNVAPAFGDQDSATSGIQEDETTRSVLENSDADMDVGGPVEAADDDELTYSLNGLDAGSFTIVRGTGQIKVGPGTELDYETKDTYTVTVTATDPALESATITVTIMVTDVNETPAILKKALVIGGRRSIDYPETDERPVATYMAAGPESARARWRLSGDDARDFSITTGGVLSFNVPPDFEAPVDQDEDNEYRLTVHASDGENTAERDVTVTVANVDEPGEVTLSPPRPQIGAEITATLADPDGVTEDTTTWRWARSESLDGPWFGIAGAVLETYTPVADDVDSYLRATAVYNDAEGVGKTAEAVTDAATTPDDDGVVTLTPARPQIGDEVTAALRDPDGGVTGETWQWATSSSATGPWTDIAGETSASYTPVEADADRFLRATASYDDAAGAGKTASAVTASAIAPDDDGVVTLSPPQPEVGEALTATLTDPDGGVTATTWQWARSSSANGPWTNITGATAASYTPVEADADRFLRATASYTDAVGAGKTASAVTASAIAPDDDGVVTLTPPRPEVGVEVTAALTDPDGGVTATTWQWARSSSANGPWTDIAGATSATYTPVEADANRYLQATVSYDDAAGEGKSAEGVSASAIAPDDDGVVTLTPPQPQVGVEVTAVLTDPDGGVTATTWQWARSSSANGPWTNITGATAASYTPVEADADRFLRATASYTDAVGAGKTASAVTASAIAPDDDGVVTLTPPRPEVGVEVTAALTDPDGGVTATTWQWARSSSANGPWTDIAGATSATYTPVEADANRYLQATVSYDDAAGEGKSAEGVSASAIAPDDDGVVTLTPPQPQVGVEVTAVLTDPDGGVTATTWQWARSSSANGPWTDITGATTASYTPVEADADRYLQATASYDDAAGEGKSASAVSDAPVGTNRAPEFPASETGERTVPDSTAPRGNVGAPVAATDPDNDTLTYTLGGTDAASFRINSGTGQITVGTGTTLNARTKDTYTVVVTATDPSGESDTITVTITVTLDLLNAYDTNNNGVIDRDEVIAAIRDYFELLVTRDDVIGVIQLYFRAAR